MGRVTATDRRAVLLATAGLALAAGCASSSGAAVHPVRSAGAAPALPAQLTHGPRDRPRVALTFHGDGDPATARTLLTEAEKYGARVTVLAV
ncbi:MAG: polysaccharide deacetylase family protein, partial [Streptomyces sp.]|nr:polysaccharide deacetylase family protein [Streptomyces sp.]